MELFDKVPESKELTSVIENVQTNKTEEFLYACRSGQIEDIDRILTISKNVINSQDVDGFTGLFWAVRLGKTDIAELLIKSCADLNIQNKDGNTALISATNSGYKDIVELFIKAGADLNIQNIDGSTALMFASEKGYKDIVELFIKAGADLDTQDTDGSTALMFVVVKGDKDIVELLIKAGANPNIQHKNGYTALTIATAQKNKSIVELLTQNNKTDNFRVDTKDDIINYDVDMKAKKVTDKEAIKAVEEGEEQEREARKQKAIDIFFDFQKELHNSIYGEYTLSKIRSVMHQMSSFTTDRLDLTDADLEKAQTTLEEIKTNWKKVEMECFAELECETKEKENGRKELCKVRQSTCRNSDEVEYLKIETENVMEKSCEVGRESEYSKKHELIQSFAKKNYEKLTETTKNTYNALCVEMNKDEVKNAIDTVGKVINIALTEENTIKKLKEEKIIGNKTAFALKLITPIVEKKFIVLKPITPTVKRKLRDKIK